MTKQLTNIEKISNATGMTTEHLAIIKNQVLKNSSDAELAYFAQVCKNTGLDPFQKEIWGYKDNQGNLIIFAGRDGLLKAAQKSGQWGGMASCEIRTNDEYTIDIPNGVIQHKITKLSPVERGEIVGAYARVTRIEGDRKTDTLEVVDFATYDRKWNAWKSHPAGMIRKVAEANALKKAFGISGIQAEHDFDTENGEAIAIQTEPIMNLYPSDQEVNELIGKLRTTSLDHDEQAQIEKALKDGLPRDEFESLEIMIEANQADPLEVNANYGQGDISSQLKKQGL